MKFDEIMEIVEKVREMVMQEAEEKYRHHVDRLAFESEMLYRAGVDTKKHFAEQWRKSAKRYKRMTNEEFEAEMDRRLTARGKAHEE